MSTGEDAVFHFAASLGSAATYTFTMKQTYSDGTFVDGSGPEGSDTPAVFVEAGSPLGGGSSSTLAIVAIALAGVALLVGIVGLTSGKRPFT